MAPFTNILFSPLASRGGAAAARRVVALAERDGAALTFQTAVPAPPRAGRWPFNRAELDREIEEAHRQESRRDLERLIPDEGPEVEALVEMGNPAAALIGRVLAADHDLLVVNSNDEREHRTTINRLLRECPCPVWVIRPSRAKVPRVLAAVNLGEDEVALNQTILGLAASMVDLHGGELHVVHAWELYGESALRNSAFIRTNAGEIDAAITSESAGREQELRALLESTPVAGPEWKVHLEKGPAGVIVPEVVSDHRINLLVLGTIARTGVQRFVMGSTAEQVLDEVRCSVMAVKPPDFVSPLTVVHR